MLRLTARYADAWNTAWFGQPDDLLHRRLAKLNAALDAEGRDPATLRRTIGTEVRDPEATEPGEDLGEEFGGSVGERARAIDAHERLGFDTSSSTSNRRPCGRWTASPRPSSCGPADPDRSSGTQQNN
jgi:alkanesulfonate monooxygenase SsuD/methylene tetrahydromethanopterin reductase-like flavin-dependent oxidoreductase (luciferase family)